MRYFAQNVPKFSGPVFRFEFQDSFFSLSRIGGKSHTAQPQQQDKDTMPTAKRTPENNNHNREEVQGTTLCVCVGEEQMATSVIWLETELRKKELLTGTYFASPSRQAHGPTPTLRSTRTYLTTS
jgi:hypothetical protein